jgi:chitin deacetylase
MARTLFTFDDGPGPSTPALLDVLAAANMRATFFVLGENLERRRDIAVRAARAGHELGNHTYSHVRPDAIDHATFAAELARTDAMIADVLREAGIAAAAIPRVRLPYGIVGDDPRVAMLAALGREHVGWTADFEDWLDPDPVALAARMREHIDAQHGRGLDAVLDLHDSSRLGAERAATVEAVRLLLLA